MKAKSMTRASFLLLFGLMILGLVACGSDDGVAAGQAGEVIDDAQSVAAVDTHDDDDDHAESVVDEHDADGDDHAVAVDDAHDEAEEASGHAHGAPGVVDPDAPVMHVSALEFAYETTMSEVEVGEPFSIQISNVGLLEHDITFDGLEDKGGVHVLPGEDGIATFSLGEAGEYVYYCTVPGHREAGMTGTLTALSAHVDDHDDADGHHDEAEAMHDDADDHHDEEPAHEDTDGHHEDAETMHDEAGDNDEEVASDA